MWTWGEGGSKRILLIPHSDDLSSLKQVVIGEVTPAQEHTTTLLMSAQLMLEAWHDGPGRVIFQARARDRDEIVVKHAFFEYHLPKAGL